MALDLLLRPAPGGKLQLRDGTPFPWFQAIQCCGGAGAVLGDTTNTRWPLASEEWMDYAASRGANAFHFRMGPFYGTEEAESEWKDLGGPMLGVGAGWNEPFWQKARELCWHAAKLKAVVEVVVIDTWYVKHSASSWGDTQMPWPQSDIDAAGRTMTPVQEQFIRKVVSELGGFGNVIWATDNEGNLVQGRERAWFEDVAKIIRDEERKSCGGVVHMIGTNAPEFGDSPSFDFVATHERKPLQAPIAGKWTMNNERNPSLGPEQEASYFAQAREKGLGWSLWLANLQGDSVKRLFDLFEAIAKGGAPQGGCFPPPEDDPGWHGVPTQNPPNEILQSLARAKANLGDQSAGWPADSETQFQKMFWVLEELAKRMRAEGLCAGRSRDAIFAKPADGKVWFELHAVASATGGYTGTPFKGSCWSYQG